MPCRTVFFLFETVDLTFGGVLHIIRLHLRFSAVCVILRKEICQTVLKFFGHKNSAGSASTEGCEPLQMTRKKSSKFSADASCPISAGDTGSLMKQRGDAQTEGRAMHKYFVKEKQNMCGIVGYVGDNSASPILIDGLKKLEYRGYDSAGIAVCRNGKITTVKTKGRISDLQQKLDEVGTPQGSVGIGHTRWATHGAPTDANAHPHSGSSGRVTLVHNGIIENYLELKAELESRAGSSSRRPTRRFSLSFSTASMTEIRLRLC